MTAPDRPAGFGRDRGYAAARHTPGAPPPPEPAEPVVLPEGAELDLSHDAEAEQVRSTLAGLEADLVGLTAVKRRVSEIAALHRASITIEDMEHRRDPQEGSRRRRRRRVVDK